MGTYAKLKSPFMRLLFKSPVIAIVSHWIFQSMLYADNTERFFKIGLDVILTIIFTLFYSSFMSLTLSVIAAFISGHTLNFLFNGQLWGLLKSYQLVNISSIKFHSYLARLADRTRQCRAIKKTLVYGSLTRGEMHEYSDLDLRILRKPGLANGIHACWFLLIERSRALIARFPLDAYVLDNAKKLSVMKNDETGIDIFEYQIRLNNQK